MTNTCITSTVRLIFLIFFNYDLPSKSNNTVFIINIFKDLYVP